MHSHHSSLFFRITSLLAVLLALFTATGCAKSAKSEEQLWNNRMQESTELGQKWPGFKSLIDARRAKAQPVWDEAAKLADEKAKAEKMSTANSQFFDGLVSKLTEIKYKSQGIQDTIKKINDLKLPKTKSSERSSAVMSAENVLLEVDTAMRGAKPVSETDAIKLLDDQISKLISAQGDADRAYTSLKASTDTKSTPASTPAGGAKKKK